MDFYYFFTQKGIWKQIVFLFLYYAGLIGILAMLKPYMVISGIQYAGNRDYEWCSRNFCSIRIFFCRRFILRRIGRYRSRILLGLYFIGHALFHVSLLLYSHHPDALYRDLFALGKLRNGNHRCIYNSHG